MTVLRQLTVMSTLGARALLPGLGHKMKLCSHPEYQAVTVYIVTPFCHVRRHFEIGTGTVH